MLSKVIAFALIIVIVLAVCPPTVAESQGDMPCYFVVIHNEPYHVPEGWKQRVPAFATLVQMVDKADEYNIKLTLMFPPQWVWFINADPNRLAELESWKQQGHKVAAHHHSIYHRWNWDGYTDHPWAKVVEERAKQGVSPPEQYLGTMSSFMDKLEMLNPTMNSGCLNAEADWMALPDQIIYDTSSGYLNFGVVGTKTWTLDKLDPNRGRNDYILVAKYNCIERKFLSHFPITTDQRQALAQEAMNSMDSGAYGVVVHSVGWELEPYLAFLEFLHEQDPNGEKSRTLTEVMGLLPEEQL